MYCMPTTSSNLVHVLTAFPFLLCWTPEVLWCLLVILYFCCSNFSFLSFSLCFFFPPFQPRFSLPKLFSFLLYCSLKILGTTCYFLPNCHGKPGLLPCIVQTAENILTGNCSFKLINNVLSKHAFIVLWCFTIVSWFQLLFALICVLLELFMMQLSLKPLKHVLETCLEVFQQTRKKWQMSILRLMYFKLLAVHSFYSFVLTFVAGI